MPAIQVYKSGATMIPVDEAKKAKAYICPWTNDLFSTKRGYVSHLKRLREDRMHRRAKQIRFQRKLEDMWNQPDFDAIIKWIHLHPEVFWENAKRRGWGSDSPKWDKIRDSFTITIQHLSLSYSDRISNSHNCPHNGVTNWGGDKKLKDGTPAPKGYPGFSGRITFKTSHEPFSFASNILEGTRIHTGSGGGGGDNVYSYDVKFFLDDWPGIANRIRAEKEQHEREGLFDMIKNEYNPYSIKGFNYGKSRW
jgi:hypothetical protein